ncbi:TetR family transcriptional regulator [Aliidongia dinghuensis]|uniref:TetR family transcriptional regulator n=1 Tax=Aliidongia dinghuensis TaxID=1867774 RepID=A0A8J2YVW5_9PROT|nr:TetR/AcrR family transcriptional regulator [Aliidongia dinghuensis]GGF27293.1 TetR family transcriptional regulator [Aliidongia dinghuensis]
MATNAVSRTQEERSRDMRALLVEATLDCLQAEGFHGASLSVILAHAGVSRGAWAHHFSSKQDLIAAAAEAMMADAAAAARTVAETLDGHEDRFMALIEQVWQRFYCGRHRDVLFELVVACRTDRALADRLRPVFVDLIESFRSAWGSATPDATGGGDLLTLTLFVLRGMAMQEMLAQSADGQAPLRRLWTGLARDYLQARHERPLGRPAGGPPLGAVR